LIELPIGLRAKKCHFCGSRENISRCSCGKDFCPVHGVGASCTDCYSVKLTSGQSTHSYEDELARREREPKHPKKVLGDLQTSFTFAPLDRQTVVDLLSRTILNHRFICMTPRAIKTSEDRTGIQVFYDWDGVTNRIQVAGTGMKLHTSVMKIPLSALEKLENPQDEFRKRLSGLPSKIRNDVYRALVHHNEISLLSQVVLIASGAEIDGADLGWRLEALPVKDHGPLCPWCGSGVEARRGRCRYCRKRIPEEFPADRFIETHLRRQCNDKLLSIKLLYEDLEMSPKEYAARRSELLSLRRALEKTTWTQTPGPPSS
jgi:hypothetical protein